MKSHKRKRPAAFLDRDGVLNRDVGFVYRKQDFFWMPGARRAVFRLNKLGYVVIVVTNQSGVARGFYSEQDVAALHGWINDELRCYNAHIDAFYYCPHHPTEGVEPYRRNCDCRKPLPGMIFQAMRDWDIDPDRSFLIGDKEIDLLAARSAGIRGVLATGENLDRDVARILAQRTVWAWRGLRRRASVIRLKGHSRAFRFVR